MLRHRVDVSKPEETGACSSTGPWVLHACSHSVSCVFATPGPVLSIPVFNFLTMPKVDIKQEGPGEPRSGFGALGVGTTRRQGLQGLPGSPGLGYFLLPGMAAEQG